ncbi:TetR family transcriptional regulator [Microbacterium sp. RD1]|uniref:TetR family transcriptional regulator n=1 Tax=Microbacterium sp. RD1 TaxID=3457313 RepID=UPI003FA562FE
MAALTRERILDCAVGMADRDGLDAVTLRRIAAELGVHVTSLYNHVETRDAITDGIVDMLLDQAHLPVSPVEWEEWVRTFFTAMEDIATRHPGAFAALARRPVQGARAAASFEVALAAFTRAGLTTGDAYSAVKAAVYPALTVGAERSMMARGELSETGMEDLPPESFPQFHALRGYDPTLAWSFSLEVLVAGLRAQISARPGSD